MTDFRKKVLNATKLSTLKFMSDIGLRVISTVVLTRLLAPEVYGIFAVVLVYVYILDMFSDIGLRPIILTREGKVEDGLVRTVWTISILRGALIALLSMGIAAVVATLQGNGAFTSDNPYSAPALPWALVGLGFASFIAGLRSPVGFLYERNMEFKRVTIVEIATNVGALIVTIALAFYLRSIWALVFGSLAKSVIRVILSFLVFQGPAMRLRFNWDELALVIGRGKWILGQSGFFALSQSADRLVLGFVMTSSMFGYYFIARQLVDIVMQFLTTIHRQMGTQVFTHLQTSTAAAFQHNYYRYRLFFDALGGVSTGCMIVLAPVVVEAVFDDRYLGVAPIAQTLAWGGLLIAPTLLRSAFDAERRFKRTMFLGFISTATIWVGLLMAVFIFQSIGLALLVIALHRLPEAIVLTVMGRNRGWIVLWREFSIFGFCALGALFAWPLLLLWNAMT